MKKHRVKYLAAALIGIAVGFLNYPRLNKWIKETQRFQRAFPAGSQAILENNQKFILLSLRSDMEETNYFGPGNFHGYRVLGQTEVSPNNKSKLVAAIYKGMSEADPNFNPACFMPHHGIRVIDTNNKVLDLVICFSCAQFSSYVGTTQGYSTTSSSPRPIFDKILRDAKIQIGTKWD